jgi:hypothetical protein
MRAWLRDQLITIEGTPEEWRSLIKQGYDQHTTREFFQWLKDRAEEMKAGGKRPAVSNTLPDLEWYNKHEK